MYWVPLMSASPSLASSATGFTPARFIASPPSMNGPSSICASPSPIIASARCASGARSPDAPTEPWAGMRGCTRLSSIAQSTSTSSGRTPLAPRASTWARSSIIPRTSATGRSGPTPVECDRTRFFCSCRTSPAEMRVSLRAPKPVFTP